MTPGGPIRVAVVDDHPLYRAALIAVFEEVDDLRVVLECASAEELAARLRVDPVAVQVVLLDLSLPGRSGAEAVRLVADLGPHVLVLSGTATPAQLVDVLAAGALGYLTKAAHSDEILHAVRTVAVGDGYMAPGVASLLREAVSVRGTTLPELTAREREVLAGLAAGKTDQMIAEELMISLATVRSHLDRIRGKTGRRRRADLTRLAVENSLVDG